MNLLSDLTERGLATPPDWLLTNTAYLTTMGSVAYGVATDYSDFDVYGFAIPPKINIFPHLYGYVHGFGPSPPHFDQYQQHHIYDKDKGREYDFTVFSIVRYFDLLADMNPNIVDSLFTAVDCRLFVTAVGDHVRDNRHAFLSKKLWPKFKGYAYSQLHKLTNKKSAEGKRAQRIREMGYDVKNAYNVVRLLGEAEQLLTLGDLDLRRDREMLKDIRRGNWAEEKVRRHFDEKEALLERALEKTPLPEEPDYDSLRDLLLQCLEMHYGSLDKAIEVPDKHHRALIKINEILKDVL